MPETISPALARRIALAAQGFGSRSGTSIGIRQLTGLVNRLELLQIDSVNVFERSHYMPAFSRLGAYDKAQLDRLTTGREARFTEYWAHEASFLPVEVWPLFHWRMQHFRDRSAQNTDDWSNANRPMLDWLLAELAASGPLPASAIEHDANRRSGPWWGWSEVKTGLETLFRWGDVVSGGRERFERVYALPEQVFRFSTERIAPVAVTRDGRHFFEVEGKLDSASDVLRPGLEGIARIAAPERPLASAVGHRIRTWIRMSLWSLGWW